MTIDDAARLRLYESARRTLGTEEADTLMSSLPASDWDRLATKDDLTLAFGNQRTEFKQDIAEVRLEMAAMRTELKQDVSDLRADMLDRSERMSRTFVVSMVASNATLVGMVLAAVRLGG